MLDDLVDLSLVYGDQNPSILAVQLLTAILLSFAVRFYYMKFAAPMGNLGNIGNVADTRVDGQSAARYIYESILEPNAFVVSECPNGPCADPSVMQASNFGGRMAEQDMADLIAYYLTLQNE